MRGRRSGAMIIAGCLMLALSACSPAAVQKVENLQNDIPGIGNSGLRVHAVRSIKSITIHRVAVMPLIDYPGITERNAIQPGAAQSLTAQLYSQMQLAGGWEMVPEEDVINAMSKLPPTTRENMERNALALARQVSADGVLYGTVHNYQDRIGTSFAASQPASVAFTLMFDDVPKKREIWRAQFAKTQESLSRNAFDIVSWLHNQGRWVRAVDIATTGVREAVSNLHSQLNLTPNAHYFAVPNELTPGPH
ncbi:MAG: hypothetical protein ACREP6_13560 [Candidatus Binataceae bacterium]